MDGIWTVWGDPHAQPNNLEYIGTLFDISEELGHPVLILGDLLHTKDLIRAVVLNYLIERFKRSKLQFRIIVGNHDYTNLECLQHALEALKFLPNVEVIDEPTTRPLIGNSWSKGEPLMLLMPYYHDLQAFRTAIETKRKAAKEALTPMPLLVMHQGITGFDYGNGFIAENELDLEELTSFELVVSGHFHKMQKKGNLIYPGTPFSHSFGESNQDKFLGILDTNTLEMKMFRTSFPRHITIEVDCDAETAEAIEIPENDYVRVILTGSEAAVNAFDKSRFEGVKLISKPTIDDTQDVVVSEEDSNEVKFSKWAVDVKKLDSDTVSLGLEILRSVK